MFTESNTVEAYLYDLLSGPAKFVPTNATKEPILLKKSVFRESL